MITELSEAQVAQFGPHVKKWTDIGLSTEPTNRPAAEKAISDVYRLAGLSQPDRVIWARSPVELARIMARIRANESDDPTLGVWDLEGDMPAQIAAFRAGLDWTSKGGKAVARYEREVSSCCIYGQHDAGFLSFYDFFAEHCGLVEEVAPLAGLIELAKHAGWCAPFQYICFASDRPTELHLDGEGRLSNDSGPSIAYGDGWACYHLHGTEIPAEWITHREDLEPETALTWPNIEQRRCAAEIIGWSRVLEGLDARVIDENPDPSIGTLFECDIPDAPGSRFLRVKCATGRDFVIPTEENISTALAAQEFMWGLKPGEYVPEIQS